MMRYGLCALKKPYVILFLLISTQSSRADDPASLLKEAEQRNEIIGKITETLNNPQTQLGSCENFLRSDDSTIYNLAIEICLGSENKRIRKMVLKQIIQTRDSLPVTIDKPAKFTDVQQNTYNLFNGLTLSNLKIHPGDKITAVTNVTAKYRNGSLNEGGMIFDFDYNGNCRLTLNQFSEGTLGGNLTCTYITPSTAKRMGGKEVRLPARVGLL